MSRGGRSVHWTGRRRSGVIRCRSCWCCWRQSVDRPGCGGRRCSVIRRRNRILGRRGCIWSTRCHRWSVNWTRRRRCGIVRSWGRSCCWWQSIGQPGSRGVINWSSCRLCIGRLGDRKRCCWSIRDRSSCCEVWKRRRRRWIRRLGVNRWRSRHWRICSGSRLQLVDEIHKGSESFWSATGSSGELVHQRGRNLLAILGN